MKFLTKEIKNKFAKIGSQAEVEDPVVIAKFFNPCGGQTWLATEYDEENKMFYGYVSLFNTEHENEWGYFSQEELESIKTRPFGLGIERDMYFNSAPISEVKVREGIL